MKRISATGPIRTRQSHALCQSRPQSQSQSQSESESESEASESASQQEQQRFWLLVLLVRSHKKLCQQKKYCPYYGQQPKSYSSPRLRGSCLCPRHGLCTDFLLKSLHDLFARAPNEIQTFEPFKIHKICTSINYIRTYQYTVLLCTYIHT